MVSAGRETERSAVETGSVTLTLEAPLETAALLDAFSSGVEVASGWLVDVFDSAALEVSVTTPVGARRMPDEDTDAVASGTELENASLVGAT